MKVVEKNTPMQACSCTSLADTDVQTLEQTLEYAQTDTDTHIHTHTHTDTHTQTHFCAWTCRLMTETSKQLACAAIATSSPTVYSRKAVPVPWEATGLPATKPFLHGAWSDIKRERTAG